jgi:hypothetical protein
MNVRLLAALLCLTVLSTGCIIDRDPDHDPEPRPGDVSFVWNFSGTSTPGRCSDVPEVKAVRITIPGQPLANGGVHPCNTEGVDGIILRGFAPGIYNYALEALDYSNQVLYTANGSFTVDGNEQVSTTLAPVTRPPVSGDVTFLWAFSGSTFDSCADVPEVRAVRITIPGQSLHNGGVYACNTAGVDGITLRAFAPGGYSYTVEAVGSSNEVLYAAGGSFTVNGNKQVNVLLDPVTPPPAPGDVTFLWTFPNGRCTNVPDVKSIRITIPGEVLANGGIYACNTAGVDGIVLRSFRPGNYSFTLEALSYSGTVLYKDNGSFTVNGSVRVSVTLAPVTPPPAPGDVTFLWSFPNGRCADVPEVKSIRITIPGEPLANGGIYPCNTAGVDGIVLHDFRPGNYSFTLEALSYSNTVLYTGSGSFTVNGNVRVNYTLTPSGSASSYAYVSWSFPANSTSTNPTCAQAGVVSVDVSIDSGAWTRLSCTAGSGTNQVVSPYLSPGQHTIAFIGVGSGGQHYYYTHGTLETRAGSPVSVSYQLRPVGGMSLRWELFDGTVSKTCAQAGVTGMAINLMNMATGELVYGTAGDPQRCDGAPVLYNYLEPGSYRVYIRGTGPGDVFYTNESDFPTTLTVKAFEPKTATDAVTIALKRE